MHPRNDEAAKALRLCACSDCQPDMSTPVMQVTMIAWLRQNVDVDYWERFWLRVKLTKCMLADALIEAVAEAAKESKNG